MGKILKTVLIAVLAVALMALAVYGYNALKSRVEPQNGLAGLTGGDADETSAESSGQAASGGSSAAENGSSSGSGAAQSQSGGASSSEGSDTELPDAPDFTVYDADGNAVKLSDFAGKTVVINFWASWCPYCVQEMPDFQKVSDEYTDVVFMMINVTDGSRETMEKAKAHVEKNSFTFPVYYDTDLDADSAYGISSLPSTFVVNADGKIVGRALGMIDGDALRNALENLK